MSVRGQRFLTVLLAGILIGSVLLVLLYALPGRPPLIAPGVLVERGPAGKFSPEFWAVSGHTARPSGIATDHGLDAFLNRTPLDFIRYGEGGDGCNLTSNQFFSGTGTPPGICPMNVTALKVWCASRPGPCHTIVTLPGENNDSEEDASIASWVVHTVGFQPEYWAIGNEPSLWTHYGLPWTSWRAKDNRSATPLDYAIDVRNAVEAIRNIDPTARFVGLEAAGPDLAPWFSAVAAIDGGLVSAIAYHQYPNAGTSAPSLSQYYSPLTGPMNVSESYSRVQAAVAVGCAGCSSLPIQIGEFNGGPGPTPPVFDEMYPGAVFIAASIAQALEAGVPTFTYYTLQTPESSFPLAMVNSSDALDPAGTLYANVLPYLAGQTIENVAVRTSAPNVWSAMLSTPEALHPDHLQVSLLVVNANLNATIPLNVSSVLTDPGAGTVIDWVPPNSMPTVSLGVPIQPSYDLPPQAILLINATICPSCEVGSSPPSPVSSTLSLPAPPPGLPRWAKDGTT